MKPSDYAFMFNKRIVSINTSSPICRLTNSLFEKHVSSSKLKSVRQLALNNILSNLFIAHCNGRYLIITKSPNEYSLFSFYGLNHYTFRIMIGLIEMLLTEGYIKAIHGYYDTEAETGKRTRICADDSLISLLSSSLYDKQEFSSLNYNPPLVLKDKNKQPTPYKFSNRTRDMIKFINDYNEFISSFQILLPLDFNAHHKFNNNPYPFSDELHIGTYQSIIGEVALNNCAQLSSRIPLLITLDANHLLNKKLQGQFYRVFNNAKFTEGGRFYGAEYQQLCEEDRARILINNSPIVEIDYGAFHLHMLYHKTGRQFNGDPYTKVIDIPELRPLLKIVCLIAINSQNQTQAYRAIENEIRKDYRFGKLSKEYRLSSKDLLRRFESVHIDISNYFYKGIGIKLQYVDSQITEDVLKYFTKREIPCLCVHDSFLVPVNHKEELAETMIQVYQKHLGYKPQIK